MKKKCTKKIEFVNLYCQFTRDRLKLRTRLTDLPHEID